MFDVTGELRKHPAYFPASLFMPRWYIAATITDFLDNMKDVKPTRNIPMLVFYGCALIEFNNVQYHNIDNYRGIISDMTSSLDVELHPEMSAEERNRLADGGRLYSATLQYRPKDAGIWLLNYNIEGPPTSERTKDTEALLHELGAPALA